MTLCLRRCWIGLCAALLLTGCSAFVGQGAVHPATWVLAHQVTPEATTVDLLIRETECAGGTSPEGRILDPTVVYAPTSITITVQVVRSVYTGCQMTPEYPLTVKLSEPVGNRELTGGIASQSFKPGATPTPRSDS